MARGPAASVKNTFLLARWPVLPRRRARHARKRNRPPPARGALEMGSGGAGHVLSVRVSPSRGAPAAWWHGDLAYGRSVLPVVLALISTWMTLPRRPRRGRGCVLLCFISGDTLSSVPPWRCDLIWHRHRLGFSDAVAN